MKLDILAIGVHPDDIELSCSGTLLKHIAMGKTVGLVDLTRGELGTRGSGPLRMKEAKAAAKLMGAKARENLKMQDGFFQHTKENLIKIVKVIRKYQPDIVLANALTDRHPDHGRAAKLVSDACFIAGLVKVKTYEKKKIQPRWRPQAVYHYIQDQTLHPDFVVDITPYLEQKMDLILCYGSQFYTGKKDEALATPISGKDFLDSIKGKNAVFGRNIGVNYAEGFNVARPMGIDNLFDLL